MKITPITELPRRFQRIFRTTTPRSSNVGRPGFEQRENWQRFFDKYRSPCIKFVASKYPFCKPDAEDVFMRVAERIMANPCVTNRKPGDTFRTVLCNLCIREIGRLHNPHREKAVRRFRRQPLDIILPGLHRKSAEAERLAELATFIRNDLMDPDYVNGRFYEPLDEEKFGIWRQVQRLGTTAPKAAEILGLKRWTVYRAVNPINRWIRNEAYKLALRLGYL